jgi:cytochrome c-type biogenesis protein CcmH/NrfG
MPAARRQLWLVALGFVVLGVAVYLLYFRLRGGDIQLAQGRSLFDKGKYEFAELAYEKAVQADPANANAWYWLGITLKNEGKDKPAADALLKATELRPKNVNWLFECAEALQWAERFGEAEATWRKVLDMLPENDLRRVKAQMDLARVLAGQHKGDQAIDLLKQMLAQKEDRRVRSLLAELLAYAGRYDESIEQFRHVVGEEPSSKPEK